MIKYDANEIRNVCSNKEMIKYCQITRDKIPVFSIIFEWINMKLMFGIL